ncbi:hypothetical protein Hneap_0976 [Halothiobacillus neapolitanus c2]|uniref:Uncharacterized protein n=2 Tax=Halothiobacillus neapolitanus TaxID=927 RepID=D0KZD9_HALNC|nr:hypothetical protein Hneap_0976 [Halothiobacillus neapolitanus c2]TDN66123.1 hypothetical protein C8D83_101445 [Halothiobacillus neapolitanus]
MRATKTTLIGSVLIGIAAISSQTWADTLTPPQSTLQSMNQQQIQSQQRKAPTSADFERLNNQNKNQSKMMNQQPRGVGSGNQSQYTHQYRYGSGSMSRGSKTGDGTNRNSRGGLGH